MRPLILSTLIVLASLTQAPAQTAMPMPPSTYPDSGTFCGFMTLCDKAAAPKPNR